ncbi:MAG TPA: PIN domain-containing protein, partial [Rhodoferax sp.]|nr:PIN domain-containing protein [Rhodoferax sp.]
MPLPTAPSKRAALLSLQDFNVPARPRAKVNAGKSLPPKLPQKEEAPLQQAFQPATPVEAVEMVTNKSPQASARRRSAPTTTPEAVAPKARRKEGPSKLFVLDTNVLLHDPSCLFRFEEHDVFLPMIVLEELDGHKKGMTEVARNGRQASRSLDALAE